MNCIKNTIFFSKKFHTFKFELLLYKTIAFITAFSVVSTLVFSEDSKISGKWNQAENPNLEVALSEEVQEQLINNYNVILNNIPLVSVPSKEKRPSNLGFIFTRTGPRFLYRHYFENRLGFQVNFTYSSTELQSSYRGGTAILLTVAKTPPMALKQRRLYLAMNMELDHHAQYMKEYFDGDIRDRTDARLITEFIPAVGISIGKYVPITLEGGFALSKYTTFDGSGLRKYRSGMHYAVSLAYSLHPVKTFKTLFGGERK